MKLAEADRRKLGPLLEELAGAVEDLLVGGLTTASESTRRMLDVSFQEASRLRLLRLGSTLRGAGEELGKFVAGRPEFSRRRLCFFLHRAWLLAKGLGRALAEGDEQEFDRLLRAPAGQPVGRLEVVTLGVARKVVVGAFCAFDFRLRSLHGAGPVPAGARLAWSCVFAMKPDQTLPPEGCLLMTQKQGFRPQAFLEGKSVVLTGAVVTPDEPAGRLTLGESSTVAQGPAFSDWQRFAGWDASAAFARLRGHSPGPLDLEVELQEEVVLREWRVGAPVEEEEGRLAYPVTAGPATFHAVVNPGLEGQPVRKALDARRGAGGQPPLFGLLHYERCRLVLQPLSLLADSGPLPLTLSDDKLNMKELLKTIKF
jgi:hypothetical protein